MACFLLFQSSSPTTCATFLHLSSIVHSYSSSPISLSCLLIRCFDSCLVQVAAPPLGLNHQSASLPTLPARQPRCPKEVQLIQRPVRRPRCRCPLALRPNRMPRFLSLKKTPARQNPDSSSKRNRTLDLQPPPQQQLTQIRRQSLGQFWGRTMIF